MQVKPSPTSMEQVTIDEQNSIPITSIETITQQESSTGNESENDAGRIPATQVQQQQSQQSFFPMSDFIVPPELQIPLIVLIALIGFLAILGLSSVSVPKASQKKQNTKKNDDINDDDDDDDNDMTTTPTRQSTRSSTEVTGSIVTPAGRRSARLRGKHA